MAENSTLEWGTKGVFAIFGWGSRYKNTKQEWDEEPPALKGQNYYIIPFKLVKETYGFSDGDSKDVMNGKLRTVHESFLRTLDNDDCDAVVKAKSARELPAGAPLKPFIVMVSHYLL
jgi:hypothetical protein